MSKLKITGTVVELPEFKFALGFVETNTEMVQLMYGRVDNAPDEVTRAYQSIVTMHASVVNVLAKNALAHAEVANGAPAANVEAELVRVLYQAIETHRKQLDACEAGNPPAMPAKPDAAALTEAIDALKTRYQSAETDVLLSSERDRAESARLLLPSIAMLLEAAASGLVEPTIELTAEQVADKIASDTQELIDSGQFTEETAKAKIIEVYGATPEAQMAFLLEACRKQLGIGSEGVAVANILTTAEQVPVIGQALDAVAAILAGTDESTAGAAEVTATDAAPVVETPATDAPDQK